MSSVSQLLDSCDSDNSSNSGHSSSFDNDKYSVSSDSVCSFTLDMLNTDNQSILDETVNEELISKSEDEENDPRLIPVQISKQRLPRIFETRERTITTVNRDPRIQGSCHLPTIGVTNYRSLGPKIKSVTTDILERDLSIVLSSETWEQNSNSKLKLEVEKMCELEGLEFISCPRPSNKRGGGCAVIVNRRNFTVEKLTVDVPHKLEVVWCLVRPREISSQMKYKEYIACAYYSPPNYKKNGKLVQHIISQMHSFLVKYPRAGFVCGGDRNKMDTSLIENALPKCRQIVTKFTYKNRQIHDVILTNMSTLYAVPYVCPAVQVDVPGKGVPSDHDMAVAVPLAGAGAGAVTREYVTRTSRPMPESRVREFGQWITGENWGALRGDLSASEQAQILREITEQQLSKYFPVKECRVSATDKPWITKDIRKLDRLKKSEYRKNGKSVKYLGLLKAFNQKFESAARTHLRRNVNELMEAAPGKAWQTLKKMGAQPGECGGQGAFTLSEHLEQNLSTEESLERIVNYFSQLSCQHPPLCVNTLPDRVQLKLSSQINPEDLPKITAQHVWQIQKGKKKTLSAVPGKLPPRLRNEFFVELCQPAAIIFNNITISGEWCEEWKLEYGTPLEKVTNPANEESLRIISITHHLSITYERFVLMWLLEYVGDKLDPDQFGGVKGHSVAHYLIEIQNSILYNQDLEKPQATLMAGVDISKGFNKIEHNKCITLISDMGCPNWLLRIVVSYLSKRQLIVRFNGKQSKKAPLNSGCGQGTLLGLFCFCVMFNGAGPKPQKEDIGTIITQPRRMRKPIPAAKKKWVDDLSLYVPIRLKENLVIDTRPDTARPVPYHGGTGHQLPKRNNPMQLEVDSLSEYCRQAKLSINKEKTKCMLFNKAKKYDFVPELCISDSTKLEVVEGMKLVGYQISSDLTTQANTKYIVGRAWKRMWIIRRLKALGASETDQISVLRCQVLSVLQFAVPAWTTMLTKAESRSIQSVQKTGLYLIFGSRFRSYSWALKEAQMRTQVEQRQKIFEKFTKTCISSKKFSKWFCKTENSQTIITRSKKMRFKPVVTRTKAFANSPIPQMVALANRLGITNKVNNLTLPTGKIIISSTN